MSTLAAVLVALLALLPFVIVGFFFIRAARDDGREDRALQKRLGTRRRTRLGR